MLVCQLQEAGAGGSDRGHAGSMKEGSVQRRNTGKQWSGYRYHLSIKARNLCMYVCSSPEVLMALMPNYCFVWKHSHMTGLRTPLDDVMNPDTKFSKISGTSTTNPVQ